MSSITKHLFSKKSLTASILVAGGLVLGGCAEMSLLGHAASELSDPKAEEKKVASIRANRKVGKPYKIDGIWYYPKEQPGYVETGLASWYGDPFHGRKTANGETYNMNLMTAAHKTLPMPTEVRVTNLENGRSIVVTINDRGPFVHGRIIDLSRRAAQLLGIIQKGTAKVRVEALDSDQQDIRYLAKANTAPEERKVAAAPQTNVNSTSLEPPKQAKVSEKPLAAPTGAQPVDNKIGVEARPLNSENVVTSAVSPSEMYIQAGAFIDFDNANRLTARLSPLGPAKVYQVLINGQDFYRVRLGPLQSVEEADMLLAKLINNGHTEARIIVEQD
ncbi:septal ring lytic transglycosylase RlpA family protein [Sneathiella sp. P13V-1]|uniref:septal ring lytic transglycosylase RlpA family protein n=1 Tax=Sneathiella sp. P13V-1 TaxID=2697366 RepID=UPI002AB315E6|nr:septal ring lytic transglycosylase RlpA family protein [Sneathiella sp. P13V-1]MBE7637349.1 septal ring lytic transglycosylase RlpA family protein [Sneathiella sp. P13V-1]